MEFRNAVLQLSQLAADYNVGVYPHAKAKEVITAIVMAISVMSDAEKQALIEEAMEYWGPDFDDPGF